MGRNKAVFLFVICYFICIIKQYNGFELSNNMFTLILLSLLIIFLKSLHFIYLFQVKEYRFDRFMSLIREEGLSSMIYTFHIRYPAYSFRNLLIILYIVLTLFVLLLSTFEIPFIYYFLSFIIPFAPVFSLIFVAIGVFVTKFPAMIHRKIIILRAERKIQKTKAVFIGITGSFGKTSVKEYIYYLLSKSYKTSKTDENHNTDVGIALSILKNLKKSTEYFVTEFGAYKKGEIKNASYYIPLHMAVLTGLGNQHLDLYGSRENLIQEETYILQQLPHYGKAYVRFDIPSKQEIIKKLSCEVIQYGFNTSAEIYAKLLPSDPFLQKAEIHYRNNTLLIKTVLLGRHSIENLLPAIAIALDLGVNKKDIVTGIELLPQIEGKLSVHTGKKKALVINDAINSNVEGFISAIETLQTMPYKHKIIISKGIIELGVEKRSSYERILKKLYMTDILLYTTDGLFKTIEDNYNKKRVITFNDVNDLQKEILTSVDKHSAILIEGKFPKSFIDFVLK